MLLKILRFPLVLPSKPLVLLTKPLVMPSKPLVLPSKPLVLPSKPLVRMIFRMGIQVYKTRLKLYFLSMQNDPLVETNTHFFVYTNLSS
mgnify:CR=1 FL=1